MPRGCGTCSIGKTTTRVRPRPSSRRLPAPRRPLERSRPRRAVGARRIVSTLMSYVDKTLLPGERVLYRATRQRFAYVWVVLPAAVSIYGIAHKRWPLAAGAGLAAVLVGL